METGCENAFGVLEVGLTGVEAGVVDCPKVVPNAVAGLMKELLAPVPVDVD